MELAGTARGLGSAAALTAARGLLVEAARLKGLLAQRASAEAQEGELKLPPRFERDEWLAIWGPQGTGLVPGAARRP